MAKGKVVSVRSKKQGLVEVASERGPNVQVHVEGPMMDIVDLDAWLSYDMSHGELHATGVQNAGRAKGEK